VKEILKTNDYTAINNSIQNAQPTNLLFLPYLCGERSPINNPNARGEFHKLSLSHNQADLSRAILEGVNFGLLDCLNSIKKLGINPTSARAIGGGAKSHI
jgi:xylulokinase